MFDVQFFVFDLLSFEKIAKFAEFAKISTRENSTPKVYISSIYSIKAGQKNKAKQEPRKTQVTTQPY